MMLTLFLILERIKVPIGEASNLPVLSGINLTQFISRSSYSIVIFADKSARFDFINFAVTRFGSQISFAVASKKESISPNCSFPYCIVPYKNGKKVQIRPAPKTAIAFANWCEEITRPAISTINHIDQLRRIFHSPGTFLLGVDMVSRPDYVKDTELPFYRVDRTFFQFLNISVSAGLYVYRSADRQLIRAGENYKKFLKSPLIDVNLVNISSKPYFGGYFVEKNDIKETNEEVAVLTKLANKFKDINFALIEGDFADEVSLLSHLQYIKRPFFVLFNSSEINQNRYFSYSKDCQVIENLINSAIHSQNSFTKIVGEKDEINNLIYNEFESTIKNSPGDKLVLFANEKLHRSKKFYLLAEKAVSLVNSEKLKMYRYDLSSNEIPESLQIEQDLPILVLYPEGKDELYYDSYETIDDILELVSFGVTNKFEMPEYNSALIFKEIDDKMNPQFTAFRKKLAEEREKREKAENVHDENL